MKKTLGIIGRKVGMTQVFLDDGAVVPVTVVEAGPCSVVQKKSEGRDGYNAVQLSFLPKAKGVNKPVGGHFKKAGVGSSQFLREFRMESVEGVDLGSEITLSLFKPGDIVDVTGLSKGRGFAGVMKRPDSMDLLDLMGPMSISATEAPSVQIRFLTMSLRVTACQGIMETNG